MKTKEQFLTLTCDRTWPFTPRLPVLQALNGTQHKLDAGVSMVALQDRLTTDEFKYLTWLLKSNNIDLSTAVATGKVGEKNFSKWLTHSHIPAYIVSTICATRLPERVMTFTTRYHDFVRMGYGKNFTSCVTNDYLGTIGYYLHKPNVFQLVARDRHGDFVSRVIGRLVMITESTDSFILNQTLGTEVILFNRVMGEPVKLPTRLAGYPCYWQAPVCQTHARAVSQKLITGMTPLQRALAHGRQHASHLVYDDLVQNPYVTSVV